MYKEKYFLSDQKFLDVTSSCSYLVNVMPTIEVAAAETLTIRSGDIIDVSKAFVFHGFATLISDAINLRLDLKANAGHFTGRTTFYASSLDELFREFFSAGTKYIAPSDLRSPMIDNVFFTFTNPLFNVSGAAERATAQAEYNMLNAPAPAGPTVLNTSDADNNQFTAMEVDASASMYSGVASAPAAATTTYTSTTTLAADAKQFMFEIEIDPV
jgi:hypothetical protein